MVRNAHYLPVMWTTEIYSIRKMFTNPHTLLFHLKRKIKPLKPWQRESCGIWMEAVKSFGKRPKFHQKLRNYSFPIEVLGWWILPKVKNQCGTLLASLSYGNLQSMLLLSWETHWLGVADFDNKIRLLFSFSYSYFAL